MAIAGKAPLAVVTVYAVCILQMQLEVFPRLCVTNPTPNPQPHLIESNGGGWPRAGCTSDEGVQTLAR